MYLLITFALCLSCITWYYELIPSIKKKYRQFREVNQLVETRYKTMGMILWISCKMIVKMYWLNFLQWINTSIQHVDKHTAIVSYVLNGRLYRIAVKERRGPCDILLVTDENDESVMDEIIPFYGPNYDWHGFRFTPQFWNKSKLHFELADGTSQTFEHNEDIVIKN